MRSLSTFFRHDDGGDSADSPIVTRSTLPGELPHALRMILSSDGHRPGEPDIEAFKQYMIDRGVDLADVKLAEQDGRVRWALLPILLPGRTMLIFGSTDRNREPEHRCAARLINEVCAAFARLDVHLAQMLLEPANQSARRLFNQCGFIDLAELLYLQADVPAASAAPPIPSGYSWETYSLLTHPKFAATILQSYERSLDCPALAGLRQIEDVIASHKASGVFDPANWFLLYERQSPVAVLLLGHNPPTESMELVYAGLIPQARGQRLGTTLLRQAMYNARRAGATRITLAVDAHNEPAKRLYFRHGFERFGTKQALVRDLRPLLPKNLRPSSS